MMIATTMPALSDPGLVRSFSYIGGKWCAAASGDTIAVTDPATGNTIGEVARLSGDEAQAAVDAAQRAFAPWSALLPQERSSILRRW